MKDKNIFICLTMLGLCLTISACAPKPKPSNKVKVTYWEKWSGFEKDAMQKVVDKFNASQDKIEVEMLSVGMIDRKVLVAAAGGNPPDVAGLFVGTLTNFSDKGALMPLEDYLKKAGITEGQYLPAFWKLCVNRGHVWALPATPASVALIYNKRLFREAGLDPNRPPKTLAELDEYSEKLTKIRLHPELPESKDPPVTFTELKKQPNYLEKISKGKIIQMGYLGSGWYNWAWAHWFGGDIWNGKDKMTLNSPENIAALKWAQSYPKKYGKSNIDKFYEGFGNFSSPQNKFLCSKVAMEMQGVWMHNFIQKFAPGMEWGAASFPAVNENIKDVSYIDLDILTIPKGAKHPDEAFEFIKFVNQQENMELLCLLQKKFSPLKKVSKEFYAKSDHPYLLLFRSLAESPRAFGAPLTGIFLEFRREYDVSFDQIQNVSEKPENVLNRLQNKVQRSLDREIVRLKKRGIWND